MVVVDVLASAAAVAARRLAARRLLGGAAAVDGGDGRRSGSGGGSSGGFVKGGEEVVVAVLNAIGALSIIISSLHGETVVSVGVVVHLEDHAHVVGGAATANPPVKVVLGGGGNEVVVVAWVELEAAWGGGEAAEGDGEVHEAVGLIADCHDPGLGVGNPAGLILLLGDTVDDVALRRVPGASLGNWADEVDLVVLPGEVATVDVDNVVSVVDPEHGVVPVPVDVVDVLGRGDVGEDDGEEGDEVLELHLGEDSSETGEEEH